MFASRSVAVVVRRAAFAAPVARRGFATSIMRLEAQKPAPPVASTSAKSVKSYKALGKIKSADDLIGPGATPGEIPTDMDQSTGLERLELLGKMEGIDVFDMRPLDASRLGTMNDPIVVESAGEEQYVGCTGSPADSHVVQWLTVSRDRHLERCPECGSVYRLEYVGPPDDEHHHHHHHGPYFPGLEEPKTFADFIKPEYRYK